MKNVEHHKVGEKEPPREYTIMEDVVSKKEEEGDGGDIERQ